MVKTTVFSLSLLGMQEANAVKLAEQNGYEVKIHSRDDHFYSHGLLKDNEKRLNFDVQDNKIAKSYIG